MITPYLVRIAPLAYRQVLALSTKQQKIVLKLIETLAINPRPPGAQKVEGMTGLYLDQINNLRLIYKIEEQEVWILLLRE